MGDIAPGFLRNHTETTLQKIVLFSTLILPRYDQLWTFFLYG
jgi:hypothetical protein